MLVNVVIQLGNVIEREHVVMGIRLPQADATRQWLQADDVLLIGR